MKVVDMHCDTIAELYYKKVKGEPYSILNNDLHIDLEKMEKGDYLLQNFAIYIQLANVERPFERAIHMIDVFYQEIEKYPDKIGIVRTYDDILKQQEAEKMSALLTLEEGGICQGNLEYLRMLYRLGARMMTLTWNFDNELAYPNNVADNIVDTERGLTETGILFLEEMERLGMIVDISHLNDAGIWDVFKYTKKPFVASHSNARAIANSVRNLSDDMIRELANRGGVAGINYYSNFLKRNVDGTPVTRSECVDMVYHMKHMKQVGGIECIGLGSDFDGIGSDLEMDNASKLSMLEAEMERQGFTISEIEAVFYKNVLRVYQEIL